MKKIALCQMNIEYGNFQHNCEIAYHLIDDAIENHCDLALLPELWSSGFDLKNAEEYSLKNDELIRQLQQISDLSNLTIGGSFILKEFDQLHNSFIAVQPHKPIYKYHKIHLFHPMHEDRYFTPGNKAVPFDSTLGKTASTICFDIRFPELFIPLTGEGVETFFISAHWPISRIMHWDVLLRARAIENQAFIIAVNSVGQSGKSCYGGHSMVVSPEGEVLLQVSSEEEGAFYIEIDPALVQTTRNNFKIR